VAGCEVMVSITAVDVYVTAHTPKTRTKCAISAGLMKDNDLGQIISCL